MELLNLSTEWAESEVFSTRFFILFAIVFFIASLGFWQLGKTDLAKAYIIPTSVAAILLLIVGLGLFYTIAIRSRQNSHGVPAGISVGADAAGIGLCSVAARRRAYNRETLAG